MYILKQENYYYAQCMAYVPEVDTKLVNPNDKFQFIISKKHASCKLIESGDQPK